MEKKLIRYGVFETNSSSSHSLSLGSQTSKDFVLETIYPDEEGKIYINGGEYGWEWDKFNDSITKANYAAQQLQYESHDNLIEVIKEVTGAEDVIIDVDGGYVDHDSRGLVSNQKEWLKDFIFNQNSWCFTGNDNSSVEDSFYAVPEYKENGEVVPVFFNYTLNIPIFGVNVDFVDEPTEEELRDTLSMKLYDYKLTKDFKVKNRYDRDEEDLFSSLSYYDLDKGIIYFGITKTHKQMFRDEKFKEFNWSERESKIAEYMIKNLPDQVLEVKFELIKND